MTGTESLAQPGPREHPPQTPPALHIARLRLALRAENAGVAAISVAAMTSPRNPSANPRPMRRIGLLGKLNGGRQRPRRVRCESGHDHPFTEYDLYRSN
jgi:hypothetical protein